MATVTPMNALEFARDVEAGAGLILVDFHAEWCGPCKAIAPALARLAEEYAGRVRIAKLDADAHPEVLVKYGVRSLPTLMMFEDGRPVATTVGAQPASALDGFIKRHTTRRAEVA